MGRHKNKYQIVFYAKRIRAHNHIEYIQAMGELEKKLFLIDKGNEANGVYPKEINLDSVSYKSKIKKALKDYKVNKKDGLLNHEVPKKRPDKKHTSK